MLWEAQSHLTRKATEVVSGSPVPIPYPLYFRIQSHSISFHMLTSFAKMDIQKKSSKCVMRLVKSPSPNLKVSCTCVRVPVYRAHSISINAEFIKQVNLPDAIQAVSSFTGLDFVEKPKRRYTPCQFILLKKKIAKLAGSGWIMLQITDLLSGSQEEINFERGSPECNPDCRRNRSV